MCLSLVDLKPMKKLLHFRTAIYCKLILLVQMLMVDHGSLLADELPPLCVQTVNLFGPAYAPQLKKRTKRFMEKVSLEQRCKIIQMQEVWKSSHCERIVNGLTTQEEGLNSVHYDSVGMLESKPLSGLLTVSDGEIAEAQVEYFPINVKGPLDWLRKNLNIKKAIGIARLTMPAYSAPLLLVNTHTHPISQAVRIAQALFLFEQIVKTLPLAGPLILTGDLNAPPDSVEIRLLMALLDLSDAYVDSNGGYHSSDATFSRQNPYVLSWRHEVIDYVFYRNFGSMHLSPRSAEINFRDSMQEVTSDHYGVKVDFRVRSNFEQPRRKTEVDAEKTRLAITAIDDAIEVIKKHRSKRFKEVLTKLDQIKSRLENLDQGDPLFVLFSF